MTKTYTDLKLEILEIEKSEEEKETIAETRLLNSASRAVAQTRALAGSGAKTGLKEDPVPNDTYTITPAGAAGIMYFFFFSIVTWIAVMCTFDIFVNPIPFNVKNFDFGKPA